jgi:hypothetical protein
MSSDNGIYILKTPKDDGEGFDYRVIHAQAIENIYWDDVNKCEGPDPNPAILLEYFGEAPVMTKDEAAKKAFEMEEEILEDDFCPILEYGISTIELLHSFEWYKKKVEDAK